MSKNFTYISSDLSRDSFVAFHLARDLEHWLETWLVQFILVIHLLDSELEGLSLDGPRDFKVEPGPKESCWEIRGCILGKGESELLSY